MGEAGEVVREAAGKGSVKGQVCGVCSKDHEAVDEREEAVAAAVAVVGASAKRGVVTLCASVAHIIRKNLRLQQQVKELEGQLKTLQRLTGIHEDTTTTSHCQEYSITGHCPSTSTSTSDSLPESPSSQRCGSAPPHFPAGSLRPFGVAPRKASDPGSGVAFLRGHTRASTGNLSRCGPGVTPFVRRKYSSISLRRVRRVTHNAARMGTAAALGSKENSTGSLEQQENSSNSSSNSCIVTVAEVYSDPVKNNNNNNNTESDAVKLLAQKLTNVLQEDSIQHQEDSDDMVLCAPHPLAGCQCVLCLQLATDPDTLPYEIITDEGSLLPRGSTVLVTGRRVGTVIYFGHRKHQARDSGTSPAHFLPPSDPTTCDTPAMGCCRSRACPLGVTVQLWPPDEGEIFVPLNDVICQLDEGEDVIPGNLAEPLEEDNNNNSTRRLDNDNLSLEVPGDTANLDHTLTEAQDTARDMTVKESMVQDTWMTKEEFDAIKNTGRSRNRHCTSKKGKESMIENIWAIGGEYKVTENIGNPGNRHCTSMKGKECMIQDTWLAKEEFNATKNTENPRNYHRTSIKGKKCRVENTEHPRNLLSITGKETMLENTWAQYGDTKTTEHRRNHHCSSLSDTSSTYGSLDTPTVSTGSKSEALPRRLTVPGMRQHSLECEDDLETQYLEGDKGKLQFGDTWDSGCYMSVGRQGSECSEQFSDLESEYGSGQPLTSSIEEALNSVWKKHQHQKQESLARGTPADTFFLDLEIELQDYRCCKKAREDTVC